VLNVCRSWDYETGTPGFILANNSRLAPHGAMCGARTMRPRAPQESAAAWRRYCSTPAQPNQRNAANPSRGMKRPGPELSIKEPAVPRIHQNAFKD